MMSGSSSVSAFQGSNGRIAFISKRDGADFEIYTMNPDGSNVVRLTNNSANEERPGFSPNGSKIVYSSEISGNGDIYVMNADGTGTIQLTNSSALENGPQWSSDGTTILYKKKPASQEHGDIWAVNADGSNERAFVATNNDESGPVWEPNNLGIAFSGKRGSDMYSNIFTASITGGNEVRLTSGDGDNFAAAWSPNGNKIAFRSGRNGGTSRTPDIFVMNKDGTNQQALVTHAKQDRGPAWSPDGSKIVFYSNRPNVEGGTDTDYDIWVVNSSTGGNLVNLTANSNADDWNPDWGVATGTPQPSPSPSPSPRPSPSPSTSQSPRPRPSISPSPRASASPSSFPSPTPFNFDFNDDGDINLLDVTQFLQNMTKQFMVRYDTDLNNRINSIDFASLATHLEAPLPSVSPRSSPSSSPRSSPRVSPSSSPSPSPRSSPGANEKVLFDTTMQFAQNDNGFHILHANGDPLPSGVPTNWKQPINYFTGAWQYRINVLQHPTGFAGKLQLCMWNMPGFDPENCAFNIDHTGVGTFYGSSIPALPGNEGGWAKIVGGDLDFLNPINYRMSMILRGPGNCVVSSKQGIPENKRCPEYWDQYKDMRFRVTVIMVPDGQSFSGWGNYN